MAVRALGLRAPSETAAERQWGELLEGERSTLGDGALVCRWPPSPIAVAVVVDPSAEPGPLELEVATSRRLELPEGVHPAVGTRFFLSAR